MQQSKLIRVLQLAALAGSVFCPSWATAQVVAMASLADLSLEQLSTIEVTSVSGRPQSLRGAASSIYVITNEAIRRSAATTLPEALRLAPNLQVAQVSAGQYAISARGFNDAIANKLLVLIDGRTIYSSLFSGVFWDFNDVMLEDVDRIEVISGPGGTLWGANAVNGIINVVTRPAALTQGALVSVLQSDNGGQQSVRWGGKIGAAHVRLYGMAQDRGNTHLANGAEGADGSHKRQVGFRADWDFGVQQLTVQGDAFHGGDLPASNLAPKISGGNLLMRWDSRLPDGSSYRLQAYYDRADRDEAIVFRNNAQTVDLQFTHEPVLGPRHKVLWGAGWRKGTDVNDPSLLIRFIPDKRTLTWWNVFAQDQIALTDRLALTVGAKAEHNSYTGVELLPSMRLAYAHDNQATSWAALSRTVRAPARIDRDFYFPGNPPFLIIGGPKFQSEVANVAEVGHRGNIGTAFTYDLTAFRQSYRGLRAGNGVLPSTVENRIEGHADGLEAWATWQARSNWRLSAGYAALHKNLRFSSNPPPDAATGIANLGNDPAQQWNLRSQLDLGSRLALDIVLRRMGALPAPAVPAYTAVDARLAWTVTPDVELSLVGQNLFDKQHVEFGAANAAHLIDRKVFVKLVWRP